MTGRDWSEGDVRVMVGDCRERLPELPLGSVDAVVADPPYELGFMDQAWDKRGVAFDPATWAAVLRVAKPGAYLLSFGGTRTYHRMACAIEDAGWEIRDMVEWLYGSGFPKNAKVALKPAHEPICLARKPFRGSVAANVLTHGTGALNIGSCRVGTGAGGDRNGEASADRRYSEQAGDFAMLPGPRGGDARGRWPANLVLSHSPDCVPVGTRRVRAITGGTGNHDGAVYGARSNGGQPVRDYADADGLETVETWECSPGCPVAELDRQSGTLTSGFMAAGTEREGLGYRGGRGSRVRNDTIGDTGGASRFFYVAKASASERSAGLPPGQRNKHVTVKPIALMRWLCRLVTPPGGVVLDPFAGSGTTLIAAQLEGFGAIGIEQDEESVRTAVARLRHWRHQPALFNEEATRA